MFFQNYINSIPNFHKKVHSDNVEEFLNLTEFFQENGIKITKQQFLIQLNKMAGYKRKITIF